MFLYQHIRQKLPWSNSSPGSTQQNQTGFCNNKPSYAAMLKLDLEDAGTPPAPIEPPSHIQTPKTQPDSGLNELSNNPPCTEYNPLTEPSTFDLRSPCQPFKRHRAQLKKYFSFKAIHQGQLDQPHISDHNAVDPYCSIQPLYTLDDPRCPVTVLTKRLLYQEAQWFPKPPRFHESVRWHFTKRKGKGKRGVGRGVSTRALLLGAGADVEGEFATV
ncbi:hypothetical protein KC363_g1418 [Hortaea werneckii]|nr:hypothetical protein KC363_g1418 [Hortaea werneckii]